MPIRILSYTFSTQIVAPPTGKQLRFNAADPAPVTTIWPTTDADTHPLLMGIAVGYQFYIQESNDPTIYAEYTVVSPPVDKTSYVEFAVGTRGAGTFTTTRASSLRWARGDHTPPQ